MIVIRALYPGFSLSKHHTCNPAKRSCHACTSQDCIALKSQQGDSVSMACRQYVWGGCIYALTPKPTPHLPLDNEKFPRESVSFWGVLFKIFYRIAGFGYTFSVHKDLSLFVVRQIRVREQLTILTLKAANVIESISGQKTKRKVR